MMKSITLGILILAIASTSLADSCNIPEEIPENQFRDADLVFVGKAKEINILITEKTQTVDVTIDVLEKFKGDLPDQIIIDGDSRLHTIHPGYTHLLYLKTENDRKPWSIDCWSGDINELEYKQKLDGIKNLYIKTLNQ